MACSMSIPPPSFFFFFFNDTATTEIYTLSLHDALPISQKAAALDGTNAIQPFTTALGIAGCYANVNSILIPDRKSTRLNSSHGYISYAVFCLKKKRKIGARHLSHQCIFRNQSNPTDRYR